MDLHTIPRPGEFGYDSWENGAADRAGNAGAWTQISVDPELNLAICPSNYDRRSLRWTPAGQRTVRRVARGRGIPTRCPSMALSSWCTTASGTATWHDRRSGRHHGRRTRDQGRRVPTKQGFLFVFDRATGVPVWPIEERPVPRVMCRGSGTRRRSPSRRGRLRSSGRAFGR